jgi:ribonuclease BN (tRNA processing enzyme)
VEFAACPYQEWRVGRARVKAAIVAHRGVTLGYRIAEGDKVLCYIPDHEPALGAPVDEAERQWISGMALADGATVLIHDGQYSSEEYPGHVGWGHSSVADAVAFARRAEVERLVLFHHDPGHGDAKLDEFGRQASELFDGDGVVLAREGATLSL